jgi:F0F1-type ATP synthase assembly protein I
MASDEGQNPEQEEGPRRAKSDGQSSVRPQDAAGSSVARFFGLGVQFAAAILIAVFAGQWIDRHYGSDPWGVLVGAFVGFGAGFFSIYRIVMASQNADRTKHPNDGKGPGA